MHIEHITCNNVTNITQIWNVSFMISMQEFWLIGRHFDLTAVSFTPKHSHCLSTTHIWYEDSYTPNDERNYLHHPPNHEKSLPQSYDLNRGQKSRINRNNVNEGNFWIIYKSLQKIILRHFNCVVSETKTGNP